jgi:hypothetical protein
MVLMALALKTLFENDLTDGSSRIMLLLGADRHFPRSPDGLALLTVAASHVFDIM